MIAAFDVHYLEDGRALAAAVLFHRYTDVEPALEGIGTTNVVSQYIPGQLYRRELPGILNLITQFRELPGEMLIDGYVMLGSQPGLGHHLFEFFHGRIPVIGVAKSKFRHAPGCEVFRGASKRPLYVTAVGIESSKASERIRSMHGPGRIPTLLKRVDLLARGRAAPKMQAWP